MPRLARWLVAAGLLALLASAALLLWPLHSPGVRGTALRPHYQDFGWFAYYPMPAHPTSEDFHRAGITVPQDQVTQRRGVAAGFAAVGTTALAASVLSFRQRRIDP